MKDKRTFWLTSDLHLGHKSMIEYERRPECFNSLILDNHYAMVQPGDVLINLGDFFIGGEGKALARQFMDRLPLTKHYLIRGNHDPESYNWYNNFGFSWAGEQMVLEIFGKKILFSHEPQPPAAIAGLGCNLNIHGHLHAGQHRERIPTASQYILISQELLYYRPVPLRTVIDLGATPVLEKGRFEAWKPRIWVAYSHPDGQEESWSIPFTNEPLVAGTWIRPDGTVSGTATAWTQELALEAARAARLQEKS